MRKQIPQDDKIYSTVLQVAEVTTQVAMVGVQSSGSIYVALGLGLNQLISQVIVLQYLVYPTGFNLRYPANFENISIRFVKIAQMDVFPTGLMDKYNEIWGLTETGSYSLGLERLQYEA